MCNLRPNFFQYDGQCFPQPAHLYIDEKGEITTEYAEGNGCSRQVFDGSVLQFRIDEKLTENEIEELIK